MSVSQASAVRTGPFMDKSRAKGEVALELRGIEKRYRTRDGEVLAVSSADLSVPSG
jgi:hypothetical protein